MRFESYVKVLWCSAMESKKSAEPASISSILDRSTTCTTSWCELSQCDKQMLRQFSTVLAFVPPTRIREVAFSDMKIQILEAQLRPYNSKHTRLQFGGKRVCKECYCACFGITRNILHSLMTRIRNGEEKFVDNRSQNGSNGFHLKSDLPRTKENLEQFFMHQKQTTARKIQNRLSRNGKLVPQYVLPDAVTKRKLFNDYVDFGDSQSVTTMKYVGFMKHWNDNHTDLVVVTRNDRKRTASQSASGQNKSKKSKPTANNNDDAETSNLTNPRSAVRQMLSVEIKF